MSLSERLPPRTVAELGRADCWDPPTGAWGRATTVSWALAVREYARDWDGVMWLPARGYPPDVRRARSSELRAADRVSDGRRSRRVHFWPHAPTLNAAAEPSGQVAR